MEFQLIPKFQKIRLSSSLGFHPDSTRHPKEKPGKSAPPAVPPTPAAALSRRASRAVATPLGAAGAASLRDPRSAAPAPRRPALSNSWSCWMVSLVYLLKDGEWYDDYGGNNDKPIF